MESDGIPKAFKDQLRQVLLQGEIASLKLMPEGSNHTFLVTVADSSHAYEAIYKPLRGEQPLWDFPSGTLYKREYAAYLVSQHLSWDFIPCTVIREGPYGIGSLQQFIEVDPRSSYFTLREECPEELERIALFDCISNNADRKASHCFKDRNGFIWSIDHGLTFHQDPKLRTVIWDFAQEPISGHLMEQIANLLEGLGSSQGVVRDLSPLLAPEELTALRRRLERLLSSGRFPSYDPTRRNIPWPWF
ncbi:MAG: SCO1664 family protein [Dehalococcoidia bacterium]|jgi:uncharacterized repeat protein (TIGR03843 family)|nr:SCO1664 family protein [Dehalococcoidia bacterium]